MTDKEQLKGEYSRYTYRKALFVVFCVGFVFFLFFVSLCVGTLELSPSEVYSLVIRHIRGEITNERTDIFNDNVVWNFRIPRALFAIIAGASLSIGGVVMQSVMKNPLADPYTTGVSSGAMFGVAVAMIMGFSIVGTGSIGVVFNSILFSMLPIILIVVMAPFFRKSPASLILAGVALSYLFNSFTSLLMVATDSSTMAGVYRWLVGNLTDLTWDSIPISLTTTIIGLLILIPLSGKLNLMSLEDKDAKSLGLDVETLRVICLAILGFMTSVVISYAGIIGFVGLVVPHMIRMVIGADNRFLMPAAGAFGAVFLLGCDILARAINIGVSIPVGVVTSAIGAPIFLYLIIKQKRSMW